jgi:hypothetical protein
MITSGGGFEQAVIEQLMACDPVVQEYRAFFELFDWDVVPERDESRPWPGSAPHTEKAYVKALLVKQCERLEYITNLRAFLMKHPLLVLELGFRVVVDATQPYGIDLQRSVPSDRWLRHKQQTVPNAVLHALFQATVHALQAEIPALGEIVAIDTKHIYAWVKANNPREFVKARYDPAQQPSGDADCRLGVKRSSNQADSDGHGAVQKEYLWGYGSGAVAATDPDYGDVVLAEYTLPFNEADATYFDPLYQRLVATLGFRPHFAAADAAFDAWHIYQPFAEVGGFAAIPLNLRGHAKPTLGPNGFHRCPHGLEMAPAYPYDHSNGYRAQLLRCPLLFPEKSERSCDHEQFAKGIGCVKHINIELGGWMRITLERQSDSYKQVYRQRTSVERINSQAKDLGIETPKVRNYRSVANLNTLTYLVINARALRRTRRVNAKKRGPCDTLC